MANWSGRLSSKPDQLSFIYSEDQAAALAKSQYQLASRSRGGCRSLPQKNWWSMATSLPTCKPFPVFCLWIRIRAPRGLAADLKSTRGPALHRHVWHWPTKAISINRASAVPPLPAHGTGASLQNLSSRVTGARIALASGDVIECSAEKNNEVWQASRLHLARLDSSPPCSCSVCRLIGCKNAAGRFRSAIY